MQELAKWLRGEACGGSNWNEKINKAADLIESQAAEIAELDALRNDAVLRLDTYKALVAEAIDKVRAAAEIGKAMK